MFDLNGLYSLRITVYKNMLYRNKIYTLFVAKE